MSRHDLRARPVFHHQREATLGSPTVVMASLAVARYLQDTTGISIARIVRELRACRRSTSTSTATNHCSAQLTQTASRNSYNPLNQTQGT